jgi:flagellar protein FliJ
MKKFKYRLQRVLDYRNTLKKEQERILAMRNNTLGLAENKLEDILTAHDKAFLPDNNLMEMAELILLGEYQQSLQDSLVNQRLMIIEAKQAVDEAREAYIEKSRDTQTLVTHREKRLFKYNEEKVREERKKIDQLVVMRHRLNVDDSAK